MTLYNPLALFFLISIPIVVLMYILKQRSVDYTVPSLFLWREALRDVQASSPWQKLRKNLLLLLQLLILISAVFALARPFIHKNGTSIKEAILVLDTSVSMQAVDVKPSRFDEARREISSYIENMRPGTRVTLVSAGSSTHIVENMSSDKGILLNKLNGIKVTNGNLNTEDLKEIIRVMTKQYPDAEVVIYTDNTVKGFEGTHIKWVSVGSSSMNYAVTLLSHAINQGKITGLSRVTNFGKDAERLTVSLYANDRIVDAKDVQVGSGSSANVYWYSIPDGTRTLRCVIENEDILAIDNTAWDAVNYGGVNKTLLVTGRNVFLERALAIQPGIELYKTTPEAAAGQTGYSLYVYDSYLPPELPVDGNVIVINPPDGNNLLEVSGEVESGNLAQLQDPLLDNIKKADFSVSRVKNISLPVWGEEILSSGGVPLLIKGEKGTQRFVIFGFDLHNTDLPLKTDFPILMNNIVSYLLPQNIQNVDTVQPGASLEFNLLPGIKAARVIAPGGAAAEIAPPFPAGSYDKTGEIGVYQLEQQMENGQNERYGNNGRYYNIVHYFAVNVPAALEWGNGPDGAGANANVGARAAGAARNAAAENKTAGNGNVIEMKSSVNQGLSLQWIFILIAFLIVLAEWWVWSNGV